jgi:hypothetical protein
MMLLLLLLRMEGRWPCCELNPSLLGSRRIVLSGYSLPNSACKASTFGKRIL